MQTETYRSMQGTPYAHTYIHPLFVHTARTPTTRTHTHTLTHTDTHAHTGISDSESSPTALTEPSHVTDDLLFVKKIYARLGTDLPLSVCACMLLDLCVCVWPLRVLFFILYLCVSLSVCTCVLVCLCACVLVCLCACVLVCLCACVLVCLCACVLVCLCACVLVCLCTSVLVCVARVWCVGLCSYCCVGCVCVCVCVNVFRGLLCFLPLLNQQQSEVRVSTAGAGPYNPGSVHVDTTAHSPHTDTDRASYQDIHSTHTHSHTHVAASLTHHCAG